MEDDGSMRYNEVELLRSMCTEEELQFPDEGDPYYFTLCVRLEETSSDCILTCLLPEAYPQTAPQISVACDALSREQLGALQGALQKHLSGLEEDEMQVYSVFEWARENAAEFAKKDVADCPAAAADEEPECTAAEEDEYKPADKVTNFDLLDENSAEGQQFLQSLNGSGLFFNYESITTHPLWNRGEYAAVLKRNHSAADKVWECTDPFVGSIYITRDSAKNACISVFCTALGWDLERAFFDPTASSDDSGWETSFEKSEAGLAAFSAKLRLKDLPQLLRLGAQKLYAKQLEEDGFDAAEDDLDESTLNTVDDSVRKELDGKFDPKHRFKIVTYGRDVNSPSFGAGVVTEGKFNWSALGLTGRGKGINTKKLDGRNVEVQGRVSRSDIFKTWMTEKVLMVDEWFKDPENKGKPLTVAVYCSKGRHRSVSAAILLRDLFYPDAVCEGHGVVTGALRVVKAKTK
eukprot:gb/GFBE01024265.1/.p1 GENE.gb/GFBE01024265.1/~~gb/GFBE01024265.1/.p1  ORF type:complete len:463 (+),score=118.94 gb/GFBE01024265.1/:1-1389(+)